MAKYDKPLKPKAQRQDSLDDQLRDLIAVANHQGMYDAADFIKNIVEDSKAKASEAALRRIERQK